MHTSQSDLLCSLLWCSWVACRLGTCLGLWEFAGFLSMHVITALPILQAWDTYDILVIFNEK